MALNLHPKTAPRLRLAPNEELFPEPISGRITCRACEAVEDVPLGHPALLCSACLSDLGKTARMVAECYAEALVAFFAAGKELDEATAGDAWYAKTEAARGDMTVSPATFARAWAAAKAEGGRKAQIVAMRDWLDETAELMRRAEIRYLVAQPELEAARAAAGEPIDV